MEEFYPDEKLQTIWYIILGGVFIITYFPIILILLIINASNPETKVLTAFIVITIIEIPTAICFLLWIPYYFKSLKYTISDDFLRIQSGAIWKKLLTIPFEKIQNVEIHQGPIERSFGLGKVLIHTAGYSGQREAEGIIKGITDFQKQAAVLAEKVKLRGTHMVQEKTETAESEFIHILQGIREELIVIKQLLSKH